MTDPVYYPIFLDISRKPCLIVGGGKVAERKVRSLLKFGAAVHVVSPRLARALSELVKKGKISVTARQYETQDLQGVGLVFAATNSENINKKVYEDARALNIPVNVVDNPSLCDFIVPSIVKKGPIVIAISTSGTLPFLSKRLRKDISQEISPDYVRYARVMGRLRKLIITTIRDKKARTRIMQKMAAIDMKTASGLTFRKLRKLVLESDE